MNTMRGSTRGSWLTRISAVVAAALITAGLAAAEADAAQTFTIAGDPVPLLLAGSSLAMTPGACRAR